MTDSHTHPEHGAGPDPLAPATLLRCAADDELTDAQRAAFDDRAADAHTAASDRNRIQFEIALRDRVRRVLSDVDVPADLRGRVERALRAEAPPVVARPETRHRSFWIASRHVAVAASAAIVILSIGVIIGLQGGRQGGGISPDAPWTAAAQAGFSSFVEQEHDRCAEFGPYYERKFAASRDVSLAEFVSAALNCAPDFTVDLSAAGYVFAGVSHCAVPGEGLSIHIIFKSNLPDQAPLSLFVQQNVGEYDLKSETCYCVHPRNTSFAPIHVWARDDLVYILVDPSHRPGGAAGRSLAMPEQEHHLGPDAASFST